MAVSGVFTDLYRAKYAQAASGSLSDADKQLLDLVQFVVGEGGQIGGIPKPPDPAKTDIEADGVTALRFAKALGPADVTDDGAGNLTITCVLAANEPGLDGQGIINPPDPHLYEIGVFDEAGDMMVYATYDEQIKVAGTQIQIVITVTF